MELFFSWAGAVDGKAPMAGGLLGSLQGCCMWAAELCCSTFQWPLGEGLFPRASGYFVHLSLYGCAQSSVFTPGTKLIQSWSMFL